MEAVFIQILNMSLTASYVIAAVLLVRLLLKKAPKKYAYALWSVVAFRLLCPVSFSSALSLFNLGFFDMRAVQSGGSAALAYIPYDIGMTSAPRLSTGIPAANGMLTELLPPAAPLASANPMQVWRFAGALLWAAGMAALLLYGVLGYTLLWRRMRTAILLESGVYRAEGIPSPFILGFLRPKIYVPFGLGEEGLACVLAHERFHIRRGDPAVKLFAFLLLTLHWFNPLVWLSFHLMGRDMEMRCDEYVLSTREDIKKVYSSTLLAFAAPRRFPAASPLAFGESGVKSRIQNALDWKRPGFCITAAALPLCAGALLACAANPDADDAFIEDGYGLALGAVMQSGMALSKEDAQVFRNEEEATLTIRYPAAWGEGSVLVKYDMRDGKGMRTREPYRATVTVNPPEDGGASPAQREAPETPAPEGPAAATPRYTPYASTRCIYLNPLSSYYPAEGDSGCIYRLGENGALIENRRTGDILAMISLLDWNWQPLHEAQEGWVKQLWPVTDAALYHPGAEVNIMRYQKPLLLELAGGWYLMNMDGELWIVETHENERMGQYIWSIYAIEAITEMGEEG